MLRVKVSHPTVGRDADISQFIGRTDGQFAGCHFTVNGYVEDPDVWFIIEGTRGDDRTCEMSPGRVVYLSAETSAGIGYWSESQRRRAYLQQFARVYSFGDVLFRESISAPPFYVWLINSNQGESSLFSPHPRDLKWFQDLTELPKERSLSVICSSKVITPEHKLRLSFVAAAKDHFGDKLHWFGNGIESVDTKWAALAPYKYTIVIENRYWPNVFTEKLTDSFMSLTLPIYFGAPNATEYFPPNSMVPINISDRRGAFSTIERLLEEDPYEEHLCSLIAAKNTAINDLNFFARIATIAHQIDAEQPMLPSTRVTIQPVRHLNLAQRGMKRLSPKLFGRIWNP